MPPSLVGPFPFPTWKPIRFEREGADATYAPGVLMPTLEAYTEFAVNSRKMAKETEEKDAKEQAISIDLGVSEPTGHLHRFFRWIIFFCLG